MISYPAMTSAMSLWTMALCHYLTNTLPFAVVCSVIDVQYDVKRGKDKKVAHEPLGESLMFLPRLTSYCASITEQTTAKCNLFVLYNKSQS